VWHFQYVIENLARRLAEQGIDPDTIDTAFSLAKNPARRLEFQAWLQQYVDQGISSTVNLPAKDKQEFTTEEFGTTLMQYLPKLRGVTVYPDGARGGQPLTVVPYSEAIDWEGYEYEEWSNENACAGGSCGVLCLSYFGIYSGSL
jgi:ribonucleoside-diphosphate reductase alpha chain